MSEIGMKERGREEFEAQLAEALRRVDAPEGFAERVMGRVCADPALDGATVVHGVPRVLVMRKRMVQGRAWVGGAIAAVLVLGTFGAEQVHVRREREKAALATQQFEAAARITDQTLRQTREQLARAGVSLE
jgi:hypothetical protein